MSCTGTSNCECGCCAGTSVQTPQQIGNASGLPAVAYRTGTWASFKESMLARLSSSDYPALSALPPRTGLQTRSDDDFTIAFLDATAMMLDILTFYQERLANESYLRTATQLRSATELSRLIGYSPAPGVSASVYLAFTLTTAPGQTPDPTAPASTIPAGTQVQSVPAPGQIPQIFETSADISAKPDWNALPVQTDVPWVPQAGDTSAWLQGTSTQLQPGDLILIVGDERIQSTDSNQWDVRAITTVQTDTTAGVTYVEWSEALGGGDVGPAQLHPKFYAFRQRASLFGYNAVNPLMLAATTLTILSGAIQSATVQNGGSGYQTWDEVTLTGTGGSNAVLQVTSVGSNGAAQTVSILNAGTGYTTNSGIAAAGGNGTGLQVYIAASFLLNSSYSDWDFSEPDPEPDPPNGLVDLDATYPKIAPDGWIALIKPDEQFGRSPAGLVSLYGVNTVTAIARSAYSVSAKISRLEVDTSFRLSGEYGYYSATRQTSVLAQSEELEVAPQPLTYPLYGTLVDLETLRTDLTAVTVIAISGCCQKIAVGDGVTNLYFYPTDTSEQQVNLNPGDVLTVASAPAPNPDGSVPDWSSSSTPVQLSVQDASGRLGTVTAPLSNFVLMPSASTDPEVQEYALVNQGGVVSVVPPDAPVPHTQIQLQSALANCYNRSVTRVNANVGLATNGQSVSEIVGSGSASTPNQSFTLKQSPLTYVPASTGNGSQSTLEIQVNQVDWTEVPTLYGQGPSQPVFATLNQSDGTTDVLFGDGVEGATVPTGQNNIVANYRIGSGSSGNVAQGAITTLMDRPMGVKGVSNPGAASGGQDPQSIDDILANAPPTVVTLGRVVSITDYQNFANSFANIAKAYAIWIPSGSGRGVYLTVAGVGGAALDPSSLTFTNLATALQNCGNPLVPVNLQSYAETLFSFSANVKYDPTYDQPTVQADVIAAVSDAFGFEARDFGQSVGIDEITAVIQGVDGVVAVNVSGLARGTSSTAGDWSGLNASSTVDGKRRWQSKIISYRHRPRDTGFRLYAYLPVASPASPAQPAEILVLDINQVSWGIMS